MVDEKKRHDHLQVLMIVTINVNRKITVVILQSELKLLTC